MDSKEEYAVFVNENKYEGELNSIERVVEFLEEKYLHPSIRKTVEASIGQITIASETQSEINKTKGGSSHLQPSPFGYFNTDKGEVKVELALGKLAVKCKVYKDNAPAKNGRYKLGFMHYIIIRNGIITDIIKQG
ncbi:hypothetical protein [Salegentibacter flavus]|uniref:Uncharacterized protein n=1 Tax=Salegentibacter flavus TaxID=287099 RepID=A0A1I4Z3S3_9FLAO|nr:hypothetical protein [Salegentibacter flavus]SFN44911.1 hypothetical protein SAMN05660413_01072 [Salegentibacter flavus]